MINESNARPVQVKIWLCSINQAHQNLCITTGFTFSFFRQRKKGGQNQSDLVSACISSLRKERLPFHLFGLRRARFCFSLASFSVFHVYPLYLIFYLIYWHCLRGKVLTIIMQTLTFSFLPYLLNKGLRGLVPSSTYLASDCQPVQNYK